MIECSSPWQRKWLGLDITSLPVQQMASKAEAFCSRLWEGGKIETLLVLSGVPGTGKTHTAKAVYEWATTMAVHMGQHPFWSALGRTPVSTCLLWPDCAQALSNKQDGVIREAIESDLLILDDVGAENDPWKIAADALCRILTRREKRHTLITTNVHPDGWAEKWDVRIADRLCRNSVIVDLTTVDSYSIAK